MLLYDFSRTLHAMKLEPPNIYNAGEIGVHTLQTSSKIILEKDKK